MPAKLIKNNIIKSNEDFNIESPIGSIRVFKGQEFTIRNVFNYDLIEDRPVLFTLKEFPACVILYSDVINSFEDAIEIDIMDYFDHDKEHMTNRIKRYIK